MTADGAPPGDGTDNDGNVDVFRLSVEELREAVSEGRSKVRSLSAELAGRKHALRALQAKNSESQPPGQEVWIAEVARRAGMRHRPPPSSLRRHSLVTHLATRLQELYGELEGMHERIQEIESDLVVQQGVAQKAEAWISDVRRKGRIPDDGVRELAALRKELGQSGFRLSSLENDIQKKSDALAHMLQRFERCEDSRQDAVERYKTLASQQDRIVSAFQEQTRRYKILKSEHEGSLGELANSQATGNEQVEAALSREVETLTTQVIALERKAASGQPLQKIRALEEKVQSALSRARSAEVARDKQQSELADLHKELERLTNERIRLAQQRNQAREALSKQADIGLHAALEENQKRSELALEVHNKRLGVAEARALEHQLLSEDAQGKILSLNQTSAALNTQIKELENQLFQAQDAEVRAHRSQKDGEKSAETLRDTLNQRLRGLERETTALKEALEKENQERLQVEGALGAAEENLTLADSALESERERRTLAEAEKRVLSATLLALKEVESTLLSKVSQVEEVLQAAQIAFAESEDGRNRALSEKVELSTRVAALKAQKLGLDGALALSKEDHKRSREEMRGLDLHIQELTQSLQDHQGVEKDLNERLEGVQESLSVQSKVLLATEVREKAALVRTEQASLHVEEARLQREAALKKASQARLEAETMADRLRGAEAFRQSLEARLAEEEEAKQALMSLKPKLKELEEEQAQWVEALAKGVREQAAAEEEKATLEKSLASFTDRVSELDGALKESKEGSLELRGDLKRMRQALGELSEERDEALKAVETFQDADKAQEDERSSWGEEKARMEMERDQLHQELGIARQAALGGGRPPRRASPPIMPKAATVEPIRKKSPERQPQEAQPFEARQASWTDEPTAPVHLPSQRDIKTGRSNRLSQARRTGSHSVRRPPTPPISVKDPQDRWEAMAANRHFRQREDTHKNTPTLESDKAEAKAAVWGRPIVDLEHSAPGEAPLVLNLSGATSQPSVEPTLEEVEVLLSEGEVSKGLREARRLWRRQPGEADRLALFLRASQRVSGGIMEALAEMDERLPPHKTTVEVARSASEALLGVDQPGEAIPYLLAPVMKSHEPGLHPLLLEAALLLRRLRDEGHVSLGRAQIQSSLASLPLGALGALVFALEGYPLSGGGLRPGDILLHPQGQSDLPGSGLATGQGAWLRALPTLGMRISTTTLEELELLNPPQTGQKNRLTLVILTQSASAAVEKELKRHRRKHRHAIVPISRLDLMQILKLGDASKYLKKLIRKI